MFTKGASGMIRRSEFARGFPYPVVTHPSRLPALEYTRLGEAPLWHVKIQIEFNRLGDLFTREDFISQPEWVRAGELTIARDAELWLPELLGRSTLVNVSRLRLTGHPQAGGDGLLARLTQADSLPTLRHLEWAGMVLTNGALGDLAQGPLAGRLRGLGLHSSGLTASLFGVISESPLRECVRGLSIQERAMGDSVVQHLTCKGWKLHRLEIVRSNLSDAGLAQLAAWPGLADLEHLDLRGNSFGPAGGRALAASPYLKCSPHCSIRMPPEATGQDWADLLGPLGDNTTLVCLGTG